MMLALQVERKFKGHNLGLRSMQYNVLELLLIGLGDCSICKRTFHLSNYKAKIADFNVAARVLSNVMIREELKF